MSVCHSMQLSVVLHKCHALSSCHLFKKLEILFLNNIQISEKMCSLSSNIYTFFSTLESLLYTKFREPICVNTGLHVKSVHAYNVTTTPLAYFNHSLHGFLKRIYFPEWIASYVELFAWYSLNLSYYGNINCFPVAVPNKMCYFNSESDIFLRVNRILSL